MDATTFVLLGVSEYTDLVEDVLDSYEELLSKTTSPPAPTPAQIRAAVNKVGKNYPTLLDAINIAHNSEGSNGERLPPHAASSLAIRRFTVKELTLLNTILDEVIESGVRGKGTPPTKLVKKAPKQPQPQYKVEPVEPEPEVEPESDTEEPAPPPRPKPKPKAKAKSNYTQFVTKMSAMGYGITEIRSMWKSLSTPPDKSGEYVTTRKPPPVKTYSSKASSKAPSKASREVKRAPSAVKVKRTEPPNPQPARVSFQGKSSVNPQDNFQDNFQDNSQDNSSDNSSDNSYEEEDAIERQDARIASGSSIPDEAER